jgi:hypothetical protein
VAAPEAEVLVVQQETGVAAVAVAMANQQVLLLNQVSPIQVHH